MWWKVFLGVIIVVGLVLLAVNLYGANRWRSETRELNGKIEGLAVEISPQMYEASMLEGLPAPVQRYFQTVLKEGQPLITGVRIEHSGMFNMSETEEQWKPFMSAQRVIINPPGFVWDARISMLPAMPAYVHDAYVDGEGVLQAKLFGAITVMEQPGTPELAHGELMRFLAEAAWYPTALLPGQGVVWDAIDDTHARATLADVGTSVSLVFEFDEQGLISIVRSDGRHRLVSGEQVATPWQGRFWNYEQRNGVLIPLNGEVMWLLDDEEKPYWQAEIKRIEYEYEYAQ